MVYYFDISKQFPAFMRPLQSIIDWFGFDSTLVPQEFKLQKKQVVGLWAKPALVITLDLMLNRLVGELFDSAQSIVYSP